MKTEIIAKENWTELGESFHVDCFGNYLVDEAKVFDFAVLVKSDSGQNICYAIVNELDKETAHLSFGGISSQFKGKGDGYKGFHKIVNKLTFKYKYVGFVTETKNVPMIKLGLNEGFEIVGMNKVYGKPSLEFLLERGG